MAVSGPPATTESVDEPVEVNPLVDQRTSVTGGSYVGGRSQQPSSVYETLWRFAAERQAVYMRRVRDVPAPWTADPIIQGFRFTNPYRAADRVSQYLIRRVIYSEHDKPEDLFFRILLFKVFNRIETWELLERQLGSITWRSYKFDRYDAVLARALERGERIYSAAYIMPPAAAFGDGRKHKSHLRLLEAIMGDRATANIARCRWMRDVFEFLSSYPGLGPFLAYQYSVDLNYSELTDFSEMDFVVAGPGARDGIQKCFPDAARKAGDDLIRRLAECQEEEFERLGLSFETLWGRRLQLIDCQNLLCEVAKYARLAHPSVPGISGRSRIKQRFRLLGPLSVPWFPPKWGLNDKIDRLPGTLTAGEGLSPGS